MEIYEQAFAAMCVLLLLGAAVLVLRRQQAGRLWPGFGRPKEPGLLTVEDRVALGAQHHLYVIQFERRRVLVVTHPGGANFGPPAEGFGAVLERAGDGR
ncbi:MAG: hypothetical protein KJZ84_15725 [Bryobacteraceae bacterium]|nr:hypothetical protein [Bryobacteraceae bacterium]